MTWFTHLLQMAQQLGSLPSSALMALIVMAQSYYIYNKYKGDREDSENWRKTREEAVRAEMSQTDAIAKVADNVSALASAHNSLSSQVQTLYTLIDERVPRR